MPLINSPRQNETFRILVIDDEPDIVQSIRSVLEKRYDVDMITDPRKALDNFKAGSYDLVLLDYRMPNVNGFQLYRYLARVDPSLTICFMTAYEIFEIKREKEDFEKLSPPVNANYIIKKPFTKQDLLEKIQQLLSSESGRHETM